jgi:dienelactone hydrolase
MGAREGSRLTVVARTRNLSPWAYWRLRLDAVEVRDPCPVDHVDAAFDAWRGRARERLLHALGPTPRPVPLDAEVLETHDTPAYRREKIVFDTESTMSVPAYLLVPHSLTAPGPAVLAIHGHGPGKSVVCGLEGEGEDYGHALASRGYVVLAPDLRCFGERADWMPPDKYQCDWNLVCATLAGENPLAQNLWDMQRGVDVLQAHPLVDPTRIGAVGFSYGATIALFLAAIDERVRGAVVSGYLSSWHAAHAVPWNMCGSQVFDGLLGEFEHLDVAALVAPRALLVESGTNDVIFPIDAARATVAALARVYAHLDEPDRLTHNVHQGEHEWDGAGIPDFLEQWL